MNLGLCDDLMESLIYVGTTTVPGTEPNIQQGFNEYLGFN